jgi:hypothetical protein
LLPPPVNGRLSNFMTELIVEAHACVSSALSDVRISGPSVAIAVHDVGLIMS